MNLIGIILAAGGGGADGGRAGADGRRVAGDLRGDGVLRGRGGGDHRDLVAGDDRAGHGAAETTAWQAANIEVLGNRHFLLTAGIVAGAVGALDAQATFLPFILMERVGLTPAAFGLGMLFKSGSFLGGSLVFRALMRRTSAYRLVGAGAGCSSPSAASGTSCSWSGSRAFSR